MSTGTPWTGSLEIVNYLVLMMPEFFSRHWSETLSKDEFLLFSRRITASLMLTPVEQFPVIWPDASREDIVQSLLNANQHRGLLWKQKDICVGWVNRLDADLEVNTFGIENTLSPDTRISKLLRCISRFGGVLITLNGHATSLPVGVIFPENFNGAAPRSFFYQWILTCEMEMVQLIELLCQGKNENIWIKQLSDDRQEELEYWFQKQVQDDPALTRLELVEFRELIQILEALGSCPPVLTAKKKQIIDLRNRVMHPVRSLVRSSDDLVFLEQDYNTLKILVGWLRKKQSDLKQYKS